MRIWGMDEIDQYLSAILEAAPRVSAKVQKHKRTYINLPAAFDIETSTEGDRNWMYVWQFCIDDQVLIGRTWDQYRELIAKLKTALDGAWLIIWVHNLSYEWQYISSFERFAYESVIAVSSRQVLTARDGTLEYRCSALYSGYSLREWSTRLNAPERKRASIDYSIVRYPDTPLTAEELDYCAGDVLSVCDCLRICAERDGCGYYRLPYTNTGYVRRAVRGLRLGYWDHRSSYECYKYLAAAFRGGNTHASRFYSERILGETWCYDIESSYPYALAMHEYPSGVEYKINERWKTLRAIKEIYGKCAYVIRIQLEGVHVDLREPVPYLSFAKCVVTGHYALDNGRILEADTLVTTLTDIDLKILERQYTWTSCTVLGGYYWRYALLPQAFRDLIFDWYRRKTLLKGSADEIEYMHFKGMVNSLYGMSAENPVKRTEIWTAHGWDEDRTPEDVLYQQNVKRPALPYNVGVWCTAYARLALEDLKDIAGYRKFVYCDTDSVFAIAPLDLSAYNQIRIKESEDNNVNATDTKGRMHYLGYADLDKHCRRFATLGAKKYAYEDYDSGQLRITIAGVPKARGALELERAGGLERFVRAASSPYIFMNTGKLLLKYTDEIIPHLEQLRGHEIELTPHIIMSNCEYRLSTTTDYDALLSNPDTLRIIGEILQRRILP